MSRLNSNYFLLIATMIHLWFLLKKKPVPKEVNRLKYIAICTTTVTLVVAVTYLLPTRMQPFITFLNGANLFQHTLCPILGIVSLLFMDPVEKRDSRLALIPTGLYALVLTPAELFPRSFRAVPLFEGSRPTVVHECRLAARHQSRGLFGCGAAAENLRQEKTDGVCRLLRAWARRPYRPAKLDPSRKTPSSAGASVRH